MSFFKYLPYIAKGLQVFSVLSQEIPKAIADKKITVEEIISILQKVAETFGMPVNIVIPDELKHEAFDIKAKG